VTATLHALQRGFAEAVFTRDLERFAPEIAPGRFPPAQLLQVYRNNVAVNLTEALKAVYPAMARLVGDEFFAHAAGHYLRHHPPASGNLHDFGAVFADFLAAFEPARGLDYLPDVARLEWAWHRPIPCKASAIGLAGYARHEKYFCHPPSAPLYCSAPTVK